MSAETVVVPYSYSGRDLLVTLAASSRDEMPEVRSVRIDDEIGGWAPSLAEEIAANETAMADLYQIGMQALAEREEAQAEDAAEQRAEQARDDRRMGLDR